MKNKIFQYAVPLVLAVAFIVWAWFRLVVQNGELLYEAQEQSFWQSGELYWNQMLDKPGGWICWVGRYLTQFFYYPALGASMLIFLWLAIYLLSLFGWRLAWYLSPLALILPTLLLFHVTSPGFYIYVNKVPDWWFAPTLMCLLCALLQAFISLFIAKKARFAAPVLLICLFGYFFSWTSQCSVPHLLLKPFHPALSDTRFIGEMRMEQAAEKADWAEVISEYKQCPDAPTRAMWIYKNVALLNQGRLLDDWLNYDIMTIKPSFHDSVYVAMVGGAGPMLYYQFGNIEFAYRWCIEHMVEYGPSVKKLRLMVRCAMIKGEWALAEKYLNLLSRTTFYKEWSEHQRRFLYHPELLKEDPEYRMPMLLSDSHVNFLDGDESKAENYIINTFVNNNFHHSPEHSEVSLMLAMQKQNIQVFWEMFGYYVRLHPNPVVARSVQEAAYLFIKLEPQSAPTTNLPFDKEVIAGYEKFNARSQELMRMGYKDDMLSRAMYREFGKTYYWFYFFARNLRTY